MRRVLSIDGGGIKGAFPAAFLAGIEESVEGRLVDYFDLVVGTSTGGILALGLGLGFSAAELLGFYERLGSQVFGRNALSVLSRRLFRAKYDPRPLHDALAETFGDARIGRSSVRLVVPSLDLERGTVHLWKTAHRPRFRKDHLQPAVEAARATSAAPSFFPSYVSASGAPFVDGGVWANNPVAVAAVEAVGVLGWSPGEVRVLSVGCTSEPFGVSLARRWSMGEGYWAAKAAELFMSAQSSASMGMAESLLGPGSVYRFDPVVQRGRFKLAKTSEVGSLAGLGANCAREALPKLQDAFFGAPAEPFVPCHPTPD